MSVDEMLVWTSSAKSAVERPMTVDELLASLGEQSGDISLQCSATGGFLGQLNREIEAGAQRLLTLQDRMTSLDAIQLDSKGAANELLTTAENAQSTLEKGNRVASISFDKVSGLIDGIAGLESELVALVESIGAIGTISKAMRDIAEQTRILGFNALIEAERGGEITKPFAVVANEIRKLATKTSDSSIDVEQRLKQVEAAARGLIAGVEENIQSSRGTGGHLDSLRGTLADMAAMVVQFRERSQAIVTCTQQTAQEVAGLSLGLHDYQQVASASAERADEARQQLDMLESRANDMLNQVAHGGVQTRNSPYIALALEGAGEVSRLLARALEAGDLKERDLFDTQYRPIPGTEPIQFDNGFADFADRWIRPILDRRTAQDHAIVGCCLVDMNGYLPTHISGRSQPQKPGQRKWNLEFSRNRQIFMDSQTRRALDDDGEFFLYAYRQDFGDGRFRALRSVLVPLEFEGRRWGLYEVGYLI